MSHNVEVSGVEFRDIEVLKQAVSEIMRENNQQGALLTGEGATIRGWAGRSERVDAAIKCPGENYDIGFKNKDGALVPYFEHGFRPRLFAADHTAKPVGENAPVDWHNASTIGKLSQRYAVLMAERNARQQGLTTRRVVDAAKGQIRLEIH